MFGIASGAYFGVSEGHSVALMVVGMVVVVVVVVVKVVGMVRVVVGVVVGMVVVVVVVVVVGMVGMVVEVRVGIVGMVVGVGGVGGGAGDGAGGTCVALSGSWLLKFSNAPEEGRETGCPGVATRGVGIRGDDSRGPRRAPEAAPEIEASTGVGRDCEGAV